MKSLRKRGKYLDEDLIAYILYETLKVDTAEDFNFSVFDPSTGYDFDEKERHKMFFVLNFLVSCKWYFCELQIVFSLHVHPGGGGTWVFFGWVCAARDSKLAPRSKKNFP